MPDGKPTKAPIIIFGTMVLMSFVAVAAVFIAHARRSEPYLQSKIRRVRHQVRPPVTAIAFNYASFGPQELAYDLIGKEQWQWQPTESTDPSTRYDIKVVVYTEADLDKLGRRFPIIEEKFMDYRYVKYDDAVAYLDAQIAKSTDPDLTKTLEATREKLRAMEQE